MSVALINRNYDTNYCEFSYDNWDLDKESIPKLNTPGKGVLSTIRSCSQGSLCIGTDSSMKILTGANEWIEY